ncbi:MAG: serine/threonine protein kinase, partial [Deltaproteobacteria bacterium]|nr:serine/threonine protein kinase [Deltaproteobacteria bacterium]
MDSNQPQSPNTGKVATAGALPGKPVAPGVKPAPTEDPLVGRVFNGRYQVTERVARGGMGKVYKAIQDPLDRIVALKVLDPTFTGEIEHDFHQRFFLEASICARLSHPNTVTIFDYGQTEDNIYYIVMEFLEGRTLHQEMKDRPVLSPPRAIHVAAQVARSVREAHALGVVHRDLKPANIFLIEHPDEADFVKVL